MELKEAMRERHTVRNYQKKTLSTDIVEMLTQRIDENNKVHGLKMKLIVNNSDGFNAFFKLILARGVRNFIILAGSDTDDLDEKLGYAGCDVMLYAQTLGLNTWWVGATYNKAVAKLVPGYKVIGIIAVGYGVVQGAQHRSKSSSEVSEYKGKVPQWFSSGVEAALLAPTALNKQAFLIYGNDDKVKIKCAGAFAGVDSGIVKYHFELGAGKENFTWINN